MVLHYLKSLNNVTNTYILKYVRYNIKVSILEIEIILIYQIKKVERKI